MKNGSRHKKYFVLQIYLVSSFTKYLSKDKNDDISKIALKYVVLLVLLELMIFETWSAPTKLIRKNPSFSSWH